MYLLTIFTCPGAATINSIFAGNSKGAVAAGPSVSQQWPGRSVVCPASVEQAAVNSPEVDSALLSAVQSVSECRIPSSTEVITSRDKWWIICRQKKKSPSCSKLH